MNKLPLSGLETFLAIAKHGSLRKAAQALGVQPPAVSYQLKMLEERIGAGLFVRTTRSIELTDAGRLLLTRAQPAITELGEALADARAASSVRKGTVRITLPYIAFEHVIVKRLAAFQRLYPEIVLEFSFNEAFVDVATEGLHAGIRMGDLIRDDMIAVRISRPQKQVFFAAPSYLVRSGCPKRPQDLLQHNCIRYRYIASRQFAEWQFKGRDGVTTIDVTGNLIVDSTNALVAAAEDGLGIGWLFRASLEDAIESGRLESLLDRYALERPGYFLYYPKANARIEVLRALIDFLKSKPAAQ